MGIFFYLSFALAVADTALIETILIDTLNHRLDLLAFLDTLSDCEVYINPVVEIEVLAKNDMNECEEAEALICP